MEIKSVTNNTQNYSDLMSKIGVHPFDMSSLAKNYENPEKFWKIVTATYGPDNFPYASIYRDMLARSDRRIILNSGFFDFMGKAMIFFSLNFEKKMGVDWKKYRNRHPLGIESPFNADLCAKDVRNFLSLDDGPISSVYDLLQDLGIPTCFVSMGKKENYLHPSFNAVGVSLPKPFVLIGYTKDTKQDFARMLMAYALGWFFLDKGTIPSLSEDVFMLNPNELVKDIEPWKFINNFTARNKRAKIFASYFLAPPSGVLKLIGNNQKSDFNVENIRKVSLHFGVPLVCSMKTIGSLCGATKEEEISMSKRINGLPNNLRFSDNPPREERDLLQAYNMWKNVFMI